ncbi:mechanosensitive ion channel family protein [Steroidobacter cummioxidans]|uniref:mechanosensitive ion channel family protein n=1 Tax=Steroidobacter cummioxidans TaxID=1803913 RepID=UPI000E3204E3|nr:mechanosensitive ion channel domain-containing protein [Steroidobacter cummioxidans]
MTRWSFIIAVLLACVGPLVHAQEAPVAEPATLSLWNRPIVTFRATVDGVPPQQRVQNSRKRIEEHLAIQPAGRIATRATAIGDVKGIVVTMGPDVAFGLVEGDLDAEAATTLEQAAVRAADRLRKALQAHEQQQRPLVVARGVGLTLLALLAFIAVIKLILMAREWAAGQIHRRLHVRQWIVGGVDILPTLATVERATFQVLAWVAIALATYLLVIFVLHAFPYTEPLAERLGGYIRGRLADGLTTVLRWLPNIIGIAAVIFMTRTISLWAGHLIAEVEHGARTVSWLAQGQARATRRMAVGLIWILGLAVAYALLPWSNNPVFQGMSIVLGLGASLASAGLVNQWISGVVLLYSRSFRIGDYIKLGDLEGYVTEMGALVTKLLTIHGEQVTVPNAVMTADKLINYSRLGEAQGAVLNISVQIGYDVPWQQVEALLLQAAAKTAGVRREPAPEVLRWELSDFSVQYYLHVVLERAEQRGAVLSELNANVLDSFALAQVQIMTPHFVIQPEKPVLAAPR